MTKVIKGLRKEGMEITEEMLGGTAPYRREHIDLLGEYRLKIKKRRSRQALQLSQTEGRPQKAADFTWIVADPLIRDLSLGCQRVKCPRLTPQRIECGLIRLDGITIGVPHTNV